MATAWISLVRAVVQECERTGRDLEGLLRRAGIDRSSFCVRRISNAIGCGPSSAWCDCTSSPPRSSARPPPSARHGSSTVRPITKANTGGSSATPCCVSKAHAPASSSTERCSTRTSFITTRTCCAYVRNLHDLVDPARCTEGTALYARYYTLHPPADPGPAGPDFPAPYPVTGRRGDVFRVARSASVFPDDEAARGNRFIERHRYFVTVPWDTDYYYWDYQKMRSEYGPLSSERRSPLACRLLRTRGAPASPTRSAISWSIS